MKTPFFIFILFVFAFFTVKINTITKGIASYLLFLNRQLKLVLKSFQSLTKLEKTLLVSMSVIFLVKAYYYVFTWPIQYDEAWTFSYYINNSWLTPFITPHNNHILYTILAKVTYHVLPFEAIYSIRFLLPIYSLIAATLLFYACSKYLKRELAVVCFIVFLATPGVIFYSLYARAYSLSMVFAAVNLICALQVFQTNNLSKNTLITLVLSSILGMYSLPSFAYFSIMLFVAFGIFSILQNNLKLLKWLFVSGIFYLLGTIVLYSPMIVATKLSWLTEAVSKSSAHFDTLSALEGFSYQASNFHLAISNWLPYLILCFVSILIFFFSVKKKRGYFSLLLLLQILFPLLYISIKKQGVPERFFAFNTVVTAILVSQFLVLVFRNLKKDIVYSFTVVLFLMWSYHAHFQGFFNWSNQYDYTIRKMSYILMEEEIDTTYLFLNYAKPGVGYHFDANKKPVQLYLPDKISKDYRSFSYQGEFPAILIDTSRQVYPPIDLNIYELRLKEKELELYLRKDNIN